MIQVLHRINKTYLSSNNKKTQVFSSLLWKGCMYMNVETVNCNVIKYQIESILNGVLAILGMVFSIQEFFILIAINGIVEYLLGFQYSPINLFISSFKKSFTKSIINNSSQVPPRIVLKINSVMMIMLSVMAVFLLSQNMHDYMLIPASLIATFSILVGTTGICPVAITYAYYKKHYQ